MKRTSLFLTFLMLLGITFTSCRETVEHREVEIHTDDVADDIEDAADEVGDGIEDAADEIEDQID